MKILDKFKRKNQEQGQPNTVENGDYTKPEALSQSVKNEKIEPGMPLNLNSTAPNNMRKVLFAGVGICGSGCYRIGIDRDDRRQRGGGHSKQMELNLMKLKQN